MITNRNPIEGTYAIVSVWESNKSWAANDIIHSAMVNRLIRKCFRVQELEGRWNGVPERSIRIEGPGYLEQARCIAVTFNQEAYITVDDRVAELRVWNEKARKYVHGEYFTQQVPATDEQNFTQLGDYRFKFI